ncbi:complex I NDUFA9 subunit family protein [Anaerolineales bacterium]
MILITGATGYIGRNLVAALMPLPIPLRCLIAQDDLKNISWDRDDPNAPEIIVGTIDDEEIVYTAMVGIHTIFHLENAFWWGNASDLEKVEMDGTRNVLTNARAARVGRIIFLSQLGAAPSSAFTLHKIKGMVEDLIRNSGLAYTIIRPGIVFGEEDAFINHIVAMLTTNPFFFLMPGQGEVSLHPLYIDDLIQMLINTLDAIELVDTVIDVGGIEYQSAKELIQTVMRVSGKRRLIISVPPYFMRIIVRFFSFILPRSLITPQWLDILATNRTAPLSNSFQYFKVHPRRFEDTLITYLPNRSWLLYSLKRTFRRRPKAT